MLPAVHTPSAAEKLVPCANDLLRLMRSRKNLLQHLVVFASAVLPLAILTKHEMKTNFLLRKAILSTYWTNLLYLLGVLIIAHTWQGKGWWKGLKDGKIGHFPASYVTEAVVLLYPLAYSIQLASTLSSDVAVRSISLQGRLHLAANRRL